MSHFELIEATGSTPESLARVEAPDREPFRIGAVQQAWHADPVKHHQGCSPKASGWRPAPVPASSACRS